MFLFPNYLNLRAQNTSQVKPLFILLIVSFSTLYTSVFSQDTLRVMQYNLLFYGSGSTPMATKNGYLRTITDYVSPSIFGANEIGNRDYYSDTLLHQVLWQLYGNNSWAKATYTNVSGGNLTNMIFYDTVYFGLKNQKVVVVPGATGVDRDMNIYNMYYHKPGYDTIFFTIAVVHLKASNNSSSRTRRRNMAQALMDTLNIINPQYLIVMGDLNLYYQTEPALDVFLNYPPNPLIRLQDPPGRIGDWHLNSAYADVHTQSTRLSNIGDGGATGGMDDRFDFILCNGALFNASSSMRYLVNSYKVIGQDTNHYDVGLLDPPANTSVPSAVLNALYYNSDHLPVTSYFIFDPPPSTPMASEVLLSLQELSGEIVLQWTNVTRKEVAEMYIEQGSSLNDFRRISRINDYSFSLPMSRLFAGKNLFRIKIYYTSGEIAYSNIVEYSFVPSVTLGNPYPNPADDYLYLPLVSDKNKEISWEIFNSYGKCIRKGQTAFYQGNNLFRLDVSGFPDGLYLFKAENVVRRLIIKH